MRVPGLVVGEEGSGGRAGPECRSAEGLTSPKRAFGSLAGRQAEGGRVLMRGREPWKMGDPHTLFLIAAWLSPAGHRNTYLLHQCHPPGSIPVVLLGGRVMIATWQSLRGWDWMNQWDPPST